MRIIILCLIGLVLLQLEGGTGPGPYTMVFPYFLHLQFPFLPIIESDRAYLGRKVLGIIEVVSHRGH